LAERLDAAGILFFVRVCSRVDIVSPTCGIIRQKACRVSRPFPTTMISAVSARQLSIFGILSGLGRISPRGFHGRGTAEYCFLYCV
jgi:hypothetical protein